MIAANTIYQIARADFLERVRRRKFLAVCGLVVYLAYQVYAGGITLRLGSYRGEVNAAWLGTLAGLVASVLLSLIGFYVVKNCVERDAETRVGAILAAMPMSDLQYTAGKALSNFAVLGMMVLVLSASIVAIDIAHLPSTLSGWAALMLPSLVLGLTAMSITGALALAFEVIPVLRGVAGNVLYFFLWTVMLIASFPAAISTEPPGVVVSMWDIGGLGTISRQMQAVVRQKTPEFKGGATLQVGETDRSKRTFLWNGMEWRPQFVISRMLWIAMAFAIAWMASLAFDRFESAHQFAGKGRHQLEQEGHNASPSGLGAESRRAPAWMAYETVETRIKPQRRFARIVVMEFLLLMLHRAWWWYAVAVALFVTCLITPIAWARSGGIVMAWLWPMPLWSQLGTLESRYTTKPLVYSAAAALPQQTLASWFAGVLVTAATGGGLGLHLLLVREWLGFAGWLSAILFIPAVALVLGVLTEAPRAFEAVYTVWCFLGPVRHGRGFDFMATTNRTAAPGFYLASAAISVVLACALRKFSVACSPRQWLVRRQLRRG